MLLVDLDACLVIFIEKNFKISTIIDLLKIIYNFPPWQEAPNLLICLFIGLKETPYK
jgi:hypothetical protein